MTQDWQSFVKTVQHDRRESKIPAKWRITPEVLAQATDLDVTKRIPTHLSSDEIEITGKTASELVRLMASGSLTSVQVTSAFCHRAAVAHQYLCCLTEVLFEQALKKAQELDDYFKATGKTKGPLHGLPVSIKDEHNVAGTLTTWGFVEFARDGPVENDSAVAITVQNAGAVIFCKTNVPQSLLSFECSNAVWGTTVSPFNRKVVPGGSSGGEGCLIGAGGSPLGVGSDIGGSIRVPSSINGLYGLKPSTRRFAYNGSKMPFVGTPDGVLPVNGPLASSVEDIELYTRVQCGIEGWRIDPNVLPRPYVKPELPKKLRVGYILDNGICKPVGPVDRAVRKVLSSLEKAGHTTVDAKFTSGGDMMFLTIDLLSSYNKHVAEIVAKGGEGYIPSVKPHFLHERPIPNVEDLWPQIAKREALKQQFLSIFEDNNLDFIVAPVIGLPSYLHDRSWDAGAAGSYTMAFNLLDLPVGVVPVTTVTPEDKPKEKFVGRHPAEQVVHDMFEAEFDSFVNVPIGVQIVGRRGFEEWVVECMKVVDKAL
ncbi:general amidase GmdB [Gonapodya prolifera JEL478]|uniref:amidase n=1 Tax=Gonapodya prolifera (strain JEL478) TaxID=1344416 RepID=A0A138ZZ03_GONPJ|nr:general amidase GmdB [Gonapodya prolifera JEL478]|eukprot:KXS09505.1 general amidase GmdB [Gonapodya prolifera JEL478]